MPINRRLTNQPKREDPSRTNKGRHPLLGNGSKHLSVWETLVDNGPLTAAGIKARTTFYHPQVLKDLMDAKLVAKLGKKNASFIYAADPKGRGIIPREVLVKVELLEDEEGYFHAVAWVVGSSQKPKGGTRTIKSRGIKFVIPMESEIADKRFSKARRVLDDITIDGEAQEVITDPGLMIIDM